MNKTIESEMSQDVLSPSTHETGMVANELIIGVVVALDAASQPKVEYFLQGQKFTVTAITTQKLAREHLGRQVALMFVNGNGEKPIVLGVVRNALDDAIESFEVSNNAALTTDEDQSTDQECKVDGKKVIIEGKEEVMLKCGSSSISLKKDGKIVLRGKYLVSRSSGVNRILGGSVQVN